MTTLHVPPDLDELIQRQRAVFTEEARGLGDTLVIMGTGNLGRNLGERVQHFPVTLACFCDNNTAKQGTALMDRPVLSVEEAVRQHGGKAAFVVGIFNGSAAEAQLRRLGCKAVVTAATLCRHFGAPLNPFASIDYPTAIYEQRADMERMAALWADDTSREEYARVLSWFLADRQQTLAEHDPATETYVPPGLWKMGAGEHFVDCGAFDGDSAAFMLGQPGYDFRAVTAFEPDPHNFESLKKNLAALPGAVHLKIRTVNAALGSAAGTVHFSDLGSAASSVGDGGGIAVRCVRLDDELRDDPPTLLKMDVEGYELEALGGAREIITDHAPVLAVTTYHKVEHLWQIPLLLHGFRPDYRLYLRRNAEDCWETVCYAVPPERAKG